MKLRIWVWNWQKHTKECYLPPFHIFHEIRLPFVKVFGFAVEPNLSIIFIQRRKKIWLKSSERSLYVNDLSCFMFTRNYNKFSVTFYVLTFVLSSSTYVRNILTSLFTGTASAHLSPAIPYFVSPLAITTAIKYLKQAVDLQWYAIPYYTTTGVWSSVIRYPTTLLQAPDLQWYNVLQYDFYFPYIF